jgi:hypothetical protein
MEFCNGLLSQLIECIESMQNEVKRKMIESKAPNLYQSHESNSRAEKFPRADRNLG